MEFALQGDLRTLAFDYLVEPTLLIDPHADEIVDANPAACTLLGYDRRGDMGPWLVRKIVRWMHRHSGLVPIEQVEQIDWEQGVVRVSGTPRPLEPA